ncbi:MAG: hypothetical protein ACTSSA_14055 [Candidatus Freyarchaeota archaeon]
MKGYLLSKGWQLERIHDLAVLLDEAVKYKKGRSGKSTSPNKTNHPTPP